MAGSSVNRRASSAKPKKDSKRKLNDYEKVVDAETIDNDSLFQNKILETVGIRRKKSEAYPDEDDNANLNM